MLIEKVVILIIKGRKLKLGIILFLIIIIILTMVWIFSNQIKLTGNGEEKKDYLIGVSQPNLTEIRQITMYNEIKKEAEKNKGNLNVIYKDAAQSSDKQIQDVQTLLEFGVDLLIISSNDSKALTPVVTKAYQDIPVIVLGRGVTGYDYSLFIGPDNQSIGKRSGRLALDLLKNEGGEILEILGPNNSPSVKDTSQGFLDIIALQDNIKVIKRVSAGWQRDEAEDIVKENLLKNPGIKLIFSHNDDMALGAYRATDQLGRNDIKILGIDGLNNKDGGLELVQNRWIDGTFTFPTGGKEAVTFALNILEDEKGVPKKTILRSHQVTKENVNKFIIKNRELDKPIKDANEEITLGFAQLGTESEWRLANTESIITAAKDEGIKLIRKDADGDQKRQIEHIREFIKQKVDVIVFSPLVETGWEDVLKEAKDAEIPIITSDRMVRVEDDTLWTSYIGSDFVEEGRRAALWMIQNTSALDDTVKIAELRGTKNADPAIGRGEGFRERIKNNSNFDIISSSNGDFTLESGKRMMENALQSFGAEIDIVFAHNDDMALGAIEAIEAYGLLPGKDIKLISVDATEEGLNAIVAGKLNAAVECNPLLGPKLTKAIKDLMSGKEIPINIIMEEGVFTEENVKQKILNRTY